MILKRKKNLQFIKKNITKKKLIKIKTYLFTLTQDNWKLVKKI